MPLSSVRPAARALLVACLATFVCPAHAALTQRWSFDSAAASVPAGATYADTIGGTVATVRGQGAVLDGAALVLPGTTAGNVAPASISAYLDLPNGLVSSRQNLSVEIWAAPLASLTFQRLFDFGSGSAGDGLGAPGEWTGLGTTAPGTVIASDEFALSLNVGSSINAQRLYGRLNNDQTGGLNLVVDSALATSLNRRYHYVVTYAAGVGTHAATGGGRQSWYRDGVLVASQDLPYALSALNDVNNWIGRSQFSADPLARFALEELRLYDHALAPAEIAANFAAGPDTLVAPAEPVAAPPPPHRGG